jgi:mannose-1-phosphate guanylyltransferase
MQAVLLVGGEGTRLRPLTCNVPKPIVPILNRPFLQYVITYLKRHGIDEIILTLHYLPDQIKRHLGDGQPLDVRLIYAVEETPLGTSGAVKNVAKYLDGPFVVLNGDVFTNLDLTAMLAYHREKEAQTTIALWPVEDPTAFGVVEASAQGRVRRFIEKPSWEAVTTNTINAGCYILEPSALEHIPQGTFDMFEHGLFPRMLNLNLPVYGFLAKGYWKDIGTPESYHRLHQDLLRGNVEASLPGTKIAEGVWAEEGCRVHRTAQLSGPIVMGKACTIGPNTRLIGPVVMGNGCEIGEGTVVQDAVLWSNVVVGGRCTLSRCIIGNDCQLGNQVWVMDRSVVGDNVVVGDGNKLERGVAIWPSKTIEAGALSFLRTS